MRMISKAENTSEYKYNQSNTINDTVKATKVMQLIIRPEQYNQDNVLAICLQ